MSTPLATIQPVILSGGSGTRLWPMSTPETPKQFLPLTDTRTMFQLTAARASDPSRFTPPIIVANARHAELIETQLAEIGISPTLTILEPIARNSAPAIALAALATDADAPLLVMPSDHVIADLPAFQAAIDLALPIVRQGWITTFGITPEGPETGYGYISTGTELASGVFAVGQFIEKPQRDRAEEMLAKGGYFWNGGIFMFTAGAFINQLAIHAPETLAACRAAIEQARREGTRLYPDADRFADCPSESVDYAVMEKAERVAVVPVSMGWSDVGSWDALHQLGASDASGNLVQGRVRLESGRDCHIRSDGIRISAKGIHDLIIIASGNEVLILPKGESQDAKFFANS